MHDVCPFCGAINKGTAYACGSYELDGIFDRSCRCTINIRQQLTQKNMELENRVATYLDLLQRIHEAACTSNKTDMIECYGELHTMFKQKKETTS